MLFIIWKMGGKVVNVFRPFSSTAKQRKKRTARGKENKFYLCTMQAATGDAVRGPVYANVMTAYVAYVPGP